MGRQQAVVPFGWKQVHGLPARQQNPDRSNDTDQQRHDSDHCIDLDQILGLAIDLQPGNRTLAKKHILHRWCAHSCPSCPAAAGSTMTLPIIR